MNNDNHSKKLIYYIFFPLLFVYLIGLTFWIDKGFHLHLERYGIYPRRFSGLEGILFSPFIHADLKHIFNNSIALFILTSFLFYHYRKIAWKVLITGWFFTGLLTWIIGRPSYHIGISGINYMLISFLFFSGLLIGYYRLVATSLLIVFLYNGFIWYMFPIIEHMSWESHLSGFIAGLFLSLVYYKPLKEQFENKKIVKINPEDESFLKHFDENGNFMEIIEENKEKD